MSRKAERASVVIAKLREFAHYNEETGKFICLAWRSGCSVRVGEELGHISKTNGYKYICIEGTRYSLHALAWAWMTGGWNKHQIDHINGDRLDNRFSNLRDVSPQVNALNSKRKGVGWHKASRKWRAYITLNGKAVHIGLFLTKEEAEAAYDTALLLALEVIKKNSLSEQST